MRHLPNARVQPLFYFHVCDDCPVQNGWTALHDAAWYGSCEIVNSLLSHGADVNALNHGSYTPLMYAIYRNNIEVADVLLAANPNLMACNMKRQTAYSMAVAFGRQKIASTIYEKMLQLKLRTFLLGTLQRRIVDFSNRVGEQSIVRMLPVDVLGLIAAEVCSRDRT
eukprot:c11750_g1_i3.p1 GENE.c11750_g1_i3~~c11750_g1_i3.p1  ORF type:complete len:167 (+),score=25.04 c11750_g1_i3:142-642(+)